MASRVVQPLTERLPLLDNEWIEVKRKLNHGETQAMYERMYVAAPDGELRRNPMLWAPAVIVAYLVDWSFTEPTIRGLAPADAAQALNLIDEETYQEVKDAIEAHVGRINRERQEKKRQRGAAASEPISDSPGVVTGVTSGSQS